MMKQKEDTYTLDLFTLNDEIDPVIQDKWAKKSICFIEVLYFWNDEPERSYLGTMAVTPNNVSLDDFDELLDLDGVFYVLEGGIPIIGNHGDFTVVSSEVAL